MDEVRSSDVYICHVCGAKFNKKAYVDQHIRNTHPTQLFHCDVCPKTFKEIWKLKRHQLIHSGKEPFKCEYCSKKFVRFLDWRIHVKGHTDNKPHTCHICSKQFKYKHHLRKHVNAVHLNIRNYTCKVCGAAFHANHKLKLHQIIHSGVKPFKCQFCSKECTQPSNLKTHILGVHKDLSHLVYNKGEVRSIDPASVVVPSSYRDYMKTIKANEATSKRNIKIKKNLRKSDNVKCLQENDETLSPSTTQKKHKKIIKQNKLSKTNERLKSKRRKKMKTKSSKQIDTTWSYSEGTDYGGEIDVMDRVSDDSNNPELSMVANEYSELNIVKHEPLSPKHEETETLTSDLNCVIKDEIEIKQDKSHPDEYQQANIDKCTINDNQDSKFSCRNNDISVNDKNMVGSYNADHVERDVGISVKQEIDSSKYTCQMCDKSFNSRSGFYFHKINAHKMCIKCNIAFESREDLKEHKNGHCCEKCAQVFDTKEKYMKHKITHRAKKVCKNKESLAKSDKLYYCDDCGMKLSNRRNLITHISLIHSCTTYKCDLCPMSFTVERKLTNHKLIHSGNEPFKCLVCPKKFVSYGSLRTHMTCHNNTKNYKCEICSKDFKLKSHLNKHVNAVHLNIRQYVCDICGATFSGITSLKRHTMMHKGLKPFKCQFCNKQCTQASNLKIHILGVHKDVSHLIYRKEDIKTISQIDAAAAVIPKFKKDYLKIINTKPISHHNESDVIK